MQWWQCVRQRISQSTAHHRVGSGAGDQVNLLHPGYVRCFFATFTYPARAAGAISASAGGRVPHAPSLNVWAFVMMACLSFTVSLLHHAPCMLYGGHVQRRCVAVGVGGARQHVRHCWRSRAQPAGWQGGGVGHAILALVPACCRTKPLAFVFPLLIARYLLSICCNGPNLLEVLHGTQTTSAAITNTSCAVVPCVLPAVQCSAVWRYLVGGTYLQGLCCASR